VVLQPCLSSVAGAFTPIRAMRPGTVRVSVEASAGIA
jgi:hypothetical protein